MKLTLRRIRYVKGAVSHKDEILSAETLSLGRGSDQSIFLQNTRVALEHAVLSLKGPNQISLKAIASNKFKHNGQTTNSANLNQDDLIELGGYEIRVKSADSNDAILEVSEKFSDQSLGLKRRLIGDSSGDIEDLLPPKRLASLSVLVVVLLGGFLAPWINLDEEIFSSENVHHELSSENSFFGRECTGCHSREIADSNLLPVTSFNDHPQFKVPIGIYADQGLEYVAIDQYQGNSRFSQITFPHKTHLTKELVSPDGSKVQLECSSCHSFDDAGLYDRVNFDENCAGCHRPTIPNSNGVPLPHGNLESLVKNIRDYYEKTGATEAIIEKSAFEPRALRRPGREIKTRPQTALPEKTSTELSDAAIREIVYYTGCNTCHEIAAGSGGSSDLPMKIEPIDRIEWYSKAVFNHAKHSENCADCHTAEQSVSSLDVILPPVENCQSCHSNHIFAVSEAPSECTTCHQFQPDPLTTAKNEY